jgi:magnesium transporter
MRTDVITAPEHLDQNALGDLFTRYNLQMIPVVDSEKRIKGLLTQDDIGAVEKTRTTEGRD